MLCRRPEQAREMVLALQQAKAWPLVFSTFTLEPLGLSEEEQSAMDNLAAFDWLFLGSENGVQFFAHFLNVLGILAASLRNLKIGVVGGKTAKRWQKEFPAFPVHQRADNMQQLIDEVVRLEKGRKLTILNPTSRQSLQNIKVKIPVGVTLQRIPLYQTVKNSVLDPAELEFVRSGAYDAIYFSAPSAFDFFVELAGMEPLRKGAAICVAGKTTAGHIEEAGLAVDIVPEKPDAESVVRALESYFNGETQVSSEIKDMGGNHYMTDEKTTKIENDLFIKACFRQPVERTPVWMMRQAGRYLPEYQAVRAKYDFITMYKTPEAAAAVTLQPVDILGVDAAILFSDILVIPEAMGMELQFTEGKGPVFPDPIRKNEQVSGLRLVEPESDLKFVMDAIRLLRKELNGRVPLIGFSGAPWTLATYMVEGQGSKNFLEIKKWRFANPENLQLLLKKITDAVIAYLKAQTSAGAQALQLFDTWAGILDPQGFREFALPHVKRIIEEVRTPGIPVIYFAKGAGPWLDVLAECGADVLGIDWTMDIGAVRSAVGHRFALQGNLDPTALFSSPQVIRSEVKKILQKFGNGSGHIFNLGHGILPKTPVDNARAFIESVKEESRAFHREI